MQTSILAGSIQVSGRPEVACELVHVGDRTIVVMLEESAAPAASPGARAVLSWEPRPRRRVSVETTLVEARTHAGRRLFDLKLADHRMFWREAGRRVRRQINHRKAFRVHPSETAPIRATLATDAHGPAVPVTVSDVSCTGIGVRLNAPAPDELAQADSVEIVMRLPGSDRDFVVAGAVRHRESAGGGCALGIAFDTGSPDFADVERALGRYVVDRQCDWLAARRHIR